MSRDDHKDPLKHSRFKRMPQVWRLGQDAPKAVDSLGDEFRITIYLTNSQADRAEKAAIKTGMGDLQAWCQSNLRQLVNALDDDFHSPKYPSIRTRPLSTGPEMQAEMDIPDDPAFLSEWAGIPEQKALPPVPDLSASSESPLIQAETVPDYDPSEIHQNTLLTQRLNQILSNLRAGQQPQETDVNHVCHTLGHIANQFLSADSLPRPLVRLLYRLALESQVLITEVHPRLGLDLTVVTRVRLLQSAVGKILDA